MNIFPAAPGTAIIERGPEGFLVFTAVIGWERVQGAMAFPICALPFGGMKFGQAIEHTDSDPNTLGLVTDPFHKLTFTDRDEWVAFIEKAKEPEPATPVEEDRAADKGQRIRDIPSDPNQPPLSGVSFGTKTYKTNSFWSMFTYNAIFQIEGGEPYPNDARCEKVTRDQYLALKKDGADVIKPATGEVELVDDEPAAVDEDDGMDLV